MSAKVLWLLVLVSGVSLEPTTPQYVSYNSSDISYLSNGIQFPVPDHLEGSLELSEKNHTEMAWMHGLYSHSNWEGQLGRITNPECHEHMITYIRELRAGSSWAAKISDASGRYSSQFFFGNDFWLGSKPLCEELANNETNEIVPPFKVRFHVAKIRMNINEKFTPITRQILVGQCLPDACSSTDIRTILLQERSQAKSLIVVDVRPVPGDYSILTDRKFHIAGGTFMGLLLLITLATIVELVGGKNGKQKNDAEIQNNNNVAETKQEEEKQKKPARHGRAMEILLSFSMYTNGKKILSFDKVSQESIRCIHGLRFFSIIWIIMVHTYLEVFAISQNKTMRSITERSFLYQTVSNATFSVDTFFFISGLLMTITYFRSAAKKANKKENAGKQGLNFLLLLVYRFARLTPAYLFVIAVDALVQGYAHNNSVFSPAVIDHITCDAYWWRNILYINNFFPQTEFCMLWSWYIANDTQFYILASIILVVAVKGEKHLRYAGVSIGFFLVASWITTFVIAMKYNYVARVEEPFALFDQLYDKPWMRIGPYLIGMLTGYLLFKKQTRVKLSFPIVLTAWLLSIACLLSLVYGFGREGILPPLSAIYAALGHTAWGISLAWITVACCWGYAGPVGPILAFRGFLPLSRLTYCAYLIHPVLMVITSFTMDGPLYLYQVNVLIIFLGNSVASFLLALIISLMFEAPVVRLLKALLAPNSKKD